MIILSLIPQHMKWRKNQKFNLLIYSWELNFENVCLLLFLFSIMYIRDKVFCVLFLRFLLFFENPFVKNGIQNIKWMNYDIINKVSVEIQQIQHWCIWLNPKNVWMNRFHCFQSSETDPTNVLEKIRIIRKNLDFRMIRPTNFFLIRHPIRPIFCVGSYL